MLAVAAASGFWTGDIVGRGPAADKRTDLPMSAAAAGAIAAATSAAICAGSSLSAARETANSVVIRPGSCAARQAGSLTAMVDRANLPKDAWARSAGE
jgi:hypothetical protein